MSEEMLMDEQVENQEEEQKHQEDKRLLPEEVLPPELRGRSEAEIRYVLSKLIDVAATSTSRLSELQKELDALRKASTKREEEEDEPIEELVAKNPTKAIEKILEKRGYLSKLSSLEERTRETVIASVGSKLPDFHEYEEEVREILNSTGVEVTPDAVRAAYTMVVGKRAIEEREKSKKKQLSGDKDRKTSDSVRTQYPPLEGLEKEMFEASGLSRERWEQLKNSDFYLEPPTGAKK